MTSTDGSDCGFGALPAIGLDDDRVADERVLGDRGGELRAELAVGQVQRALVDQPERGGVPERRRPAVAEDDLVAVGHREQLAQPVAHPADQVLDRRLPVRGAEQRRPRSASACSCSGRTFDGPQPKRPSAGLRSAGIVSSAMRSRVVTGVVRILRGGSAEKPIRETWSGCSSSPDCGDSTMTSRERLRSYRSVRQR